MSEVKVHWSSPRFEQEEQSSVPGGRDVHTGVLTDEHEDATEDKPVLVEEISFRLYRPGDLPPETVLYAQVPPGELPELAQAAIDAGFNVQHA